ncbi:uncharacterized protein FOMMEDRAFT_21623 [Fomitiporia mediterranea MF3/22]|uniref:uncharacterized protein n=1 Tax=Fomitiporia mediterranea (strain MF3/22) TaxID=694068 RepID=UPI000440909E|nr:uncharacterized protein FOMMEDRAFT_21623 [Fomitiporia mediterranea MF3/22]EJD01183.1 hypothetical protein FOMMEDRAFT_21623 [Fomitiporia mediterranea MF3/22]
MTTGTVNENATGTGIAKTDTGKKNAVTLTEMNATAETPGGTTVGNVLVLGTGEKRIVYGTGNPHQLLISKKIVSPQRLRQRHLLLEMRRRKG